jgi:hypothetical protein
MERCCPSRSALRENELSAALGSPGGRWVECAACPPDYAGFLRVRRSRIAVRLKGWEWSNARVS